MIRKSDTKDWQVDIGGYDDEIIVITADLYIYEWTRDELLLHFYFEEKLVATFRKWKRVREV